MDLSDPATRPVAPDGSPARGGAPRAAAARTRSIGGDSKHQESFEPEGEPWIFRIRQPARLPLMGPRPEGEHPGPRRLEHALSAVTRNTRNPSSPRVSHGSFGSGNPPGCP